MTEEENYRLYWEVIGKVILELENFQGFSHSDVASRGGIGRDVVGKLVHGNPLIQMQSFVKICQGLGIAPGLVLSLADEYWVQLFYNGDIKKHQRLQETLVFFMEKFSADGQIEYNPNFS